MTTAQFRSLSRGDIVRIKGLGPAVIETAFFHGDVFKVSIRLQGSQTVTPNIPEDEKMMFELISRLTSGAKPAKMYQEGEVTA